MSAYLKFFQLESAPFDSQGQGSLVLGTRALREAFAQIESGLAEGAPRICVSGRQGMGKTSLARALPKLLGESTRVVLLLNPSLAWRTLRSAIVKQLDLEGGILSRKALLTARGAGRRLVIVVDQAERISQESLEHLDILLNYRSDDDRQLVQCVLFSNLENASREDHCPLVWWLDALHTLQLEFAPIPASGVASYIEKHLRRAGWQGGELFCPDAIVAIHGLSGGVPGALGSLCELLLTGAAERGLRRISAADVHAICGGEPGAASRGEAGVPSAAKQERELEARRHPPASDAAAAPSQPERPAAAPLLSRVEAPIAIDSYFAGSPSGAGGARPARRRRRGRWLVAAAAAALLLAGASWLLTPTTGGDGPRAGALQPASAGAATTVRAPSAPSGPLARAKGPVLPARAAPPPQRPVNE